MDGRAVAPAAGTVLNALATGVGAAFALDIDTEASVSVTPSESGVSGEIAGHPEADTALIERCVSRVIDRYGDGQGGHVRTESEVPLAAGLKSSSAAANATVLATLDALGVADEVDRVDAARLGVQAARDAGVTVTGAFDDAAASMLGGVTMTDNREDDLLFRDAVEWHAAVWTPPERAYSADADVARCERVSGLAEHVAALAAAGDYGTAMTVNGLAFCAALDFPTAPAVTALPHAAGVSLSGTGPSYVAVGDEDGIEEVSTRWHENPGTVRETTTQLAGARTT
ncbi:shikimate kinase [Halobacterium salinarum]|uniref:shikimate kinase n=1 Tax=Halobacterium salinarum TaxID=2242 RepID=UPI001F24BEB6|nr:shikimate kinase [Halobacterium salinarum]MCF2165114.1 shikimate kinase [Halobacterium salinarum]MCF2168077.1 shikimate kinase [Halobacterium salinarum]MCF2238297.1 shikimate kinase [Halobacterium salinarum]